MEYKVICIRVNVGENIENTITTKLNSYSNQGWDLFSINTMYSDGTEVYTLVFKK